MSRRSRTVVTRRLGPWSIRFAGRSLAVLAVLGAGIVVLVAVGLTLGDYGLSVREVLRSLAGDGSDQLADYFVRELRAPRIFAALVVGAALGLAGSLFQRVTGNQLGSPDLLGFTTGAATGALLQIVVLGGDTRWVSAGAVAGGLATAAAMALLTRHHGVTGARLVLVGIGVGAFLAGINTLLIVRASLVAAQTAEQWLAGSLNAMLWPKALLAAALTALLALAAMALNRPLDQIVLGDDVARASGIDTGRVRLVAVLVGVALVSVATAATGPIAFVALAAPQVARRLMRTPAPGLAGPALTGALLVLVSDLIAQRLFAPTELAVGVVTGVLGGLYLVALLALQRSRS